jgi:hypothetical protein
VLADIEVMRARVVMVRRRIGPPRGSGGGTGGMNGAVGGIGGAVSVIDVSCAGRCIAGLGRLSMMGGAAGRVTGGSATMRSGVRGIPPI